MEKHRTRTTSTVSFLAAAAVVAAACLGDSVLEGEAPDIRGTYAGEWTVAMESRAGGTVTRTACEGTLVVETQDSTSFSGRFRMTSADGRACNEVEGRVTRGGVRTDGLLQFEVETDEGDALERMVACSLIGGSERFTGTVAGPAIDPDQAGSRLVLEAGVRVRYRCSSSDGDEFFDAVVNFRGQRPGSS